MEDHQLTQILVAARLISRSQGAGIVELANAMGVTGRTAYRRIRILHELNYPIYTEKKNGEYHYFLNNDLDRMRWWQPLPKATFSFEDTVLLEYLFGKASENPGLAESVKSLRRKLAPLIADGGYSVAEKESGAGVALKTVPVLLHDAPLGKKISAECLSFTHVILQSIKESAVCVVGYDASASGSVKTYPVHPLALFEHNGGIYAYAFQPYYGRVITLALERIRSIELTEESFEAPEGFDAEKLLADPFGIVLEEESFTARIRFDEDQARYIAERQWPAGTEIKNEEDGSIILSVTTAGTFELTRWVLGYGASAEVLEPDWLRKSVADEARRMGELYGRES